MCLVKTLSKRLTNHHIKHYNDFDYNCKKYTKVAKKNITAYKVVDYSVNFEENKFYSLIRRFVYKIGTTYTVEKFTGKLNFYFWMDRAQLSIDKGFHCYTSLKRAVEHNNGHDIMKVTIPRGTKYILSNREHSELVALKIKVNKLVEKY